MSARAVLEEAKALGIALVRRGGRIRWRARAHPAPELLIRLRKHTAGLLQIVSDYDEIYRQLVAEVRTAADTVALHRHAELNGPWVIEEIAFLDCRCDDLARAGVDEDVYRAAVTLLVARMMEVREWGQATATSAARGRHRLVVESQARAPEAVSLGDGTRIEDVGRFVGRLFTAVDYVLTRARDAHTDAILIVYLEQLQQCGVQARIEALP